MKIINSKVLVALILAILISPVWAKSNDVVEAEAKVLSVTSSIVRNLEKNKSVYKSNPAQLTAMIRKELLPFIDFDAMAKLTLGKHWRTANATQRTRFINAYREMLIRSYGKSILRYSGATIKAGNSVPNRKPDYVTVRTIVTPKGTSSVSANYDVRKKSGAWKAYNVQIAGISLVTNFRTNFTREASTKGLNALISRIEKTKK